MENVNVIERKVVVNEFMVSLAEAKLMEEMSVPHSPDLDLIHNLLCDELPYDIDLVTGILKEGRSIGGAYKYAYEFPAPLEVDRFLYDKFESYDLEFVSLFPAPREVDRGLYSFRECIEDYDRLFPAPLEADRYIYGFGWVFDCSGIEIEFPAPREVDK